MTIVDAGQLTALAEQAEAAGNHAEAFAYWSRVLELDSENQRAWIGKGIAAGYQSTLAAPRIREAISCIEKAESLGAIPQADRALLAKRAFGLADSFFSLAQTHSLEHQMSRDTGSSGLNHTLRVNIEDAEWNNKLRSEFGTRGVDALRLMVLARNLSQDNAISVATDVRYKALLEWGILSAAELGLVNRVYGVDRANAVREEMAEAAREENRKWKVATTRIFAATAVAALILAIKSGEVFTSLIVFAIFISLLYGFIYFILRTTSNDAAIVRTFFVGITGTLAVLFWLLALFG